jgi:hypothetical protein
VEIYSSRKNATKDIQKETSLVYTLRQKASIPVSVDERTGVVTYICCNNHYMYTGIIDDKWNFTRTLRRKLHGSFGLPYTKKTLDNKETIW